jgi:hypothetical protein
MHGGGGISGNGIYNNLKRDSYMPCEAMALSPKYVLHNNFEIASWDNVSSQCRHCSGDRGQCIEGAAHSYIP